MRSRTLAAAAALAAARPSPWPTDLRRVIEGGTFDPPPWNIVKGPVVPRGGPAGAILVGSRLRARWGDPGRPDMVFSVTKSYLGVLAALALDRGLIASFDDRVSRAVRHPAFAGERNAAVTWRQLLQQTSEWAGTLWGIPDSVDRDRQLAPTEDPARFGRDTPLRPPGSYWDYNDIRVNALALALTRLFGAPLGAVLAGAIPGFVAAGPGWWWRGYGRASTLRIGGRRVESVAGGGHWGGGLRTSVAQDLLFGRLVRGAGRLGRRRVVSAAALAELLRPCPLQPVYGGLWWLNTGRALFPAASARAVFALGVGLNAIWVDAAHDLVAVVRWIDESAFPEFVAEVAAALG